MAEPDPLEESPDDDKEVEPLVAWERWVSGFFGLLLGTGGVAAVFISKNQAGSAALLLIAGILLLMTVTGAPIIGARIGDNEVRLGRRRRRMLENIAAESPEDARRSLDVLAEYDPGILEDPRAAQLFANVYWRLALANIQLLFPRCLIREASFDASGADATIRDPEGKGAVDIAFKYTRADAPLSRAILRDLNRKSASRYLPQLLITNFRLPVDIDQELAGARSLGDSKLWVVKWDSPQDNERLRRALEEVFDSLESRGD